MSFLGKWSFRAIPKILAGRLPEVCAAGVETRTKCWSWAPQLFSFRRPRTCCKREIVILVLHAGTGSCPYLGESNLEPLSIANFLSLHLSSLQGHSLSLRPHHPHPPPRHRTSEKPPVQRVQSLPLETIVVVCPCRLQMAASMIMGLWSTESTVITHNHWNTKSNWSKTPRSMIIVTIGGAQALELTS